MNRSRLIPALVAALSLAACDEPVAGDPRVAVTVRAAPNGATGTRNEHDEMAIQDGQGKRGIVAGTGGSGTGAFFDERTPIAESARVRSIYSVTSSRESP